MDITQLVITVAAVVGIVLVGAMAVIPAVMEAAAGRDEPRPVGPRPVGPRPVGPAPVPLAARRRHPPVDLAA
ncbi:hypothetical protein SAMN04488543_0025 [Friedmanniella luteola]|uniref:Uncharacterized protein n=1 Tax=Friedmanniella luteola TaxID=546871 RepID=A0A1H1L1F3_9ACTN|nr:hypothetical protein [Friedmanniella luteola]SDR68428.1 hypothetical protein SAMN04488543_0025 [Friedmanniella luteola]